MSAIPVRFVKLHPDAIPFKYMHENDACMDVFALSDGLIKPYSTEIIHTGIAIELPKHTEGLIRGRSGLASVGIFCHPGTIDCNYRG